jgi:hypothetical protein
MGDSDFSKGRFEEAIETLKGGQRELREELRLIRADLIEVKMNFSIAKGGWKVMVVVGGFFAGLAGMILEYLFSVFKGH